MGIQSCGESFPCREKRHCKDTQVGEALQNKGQHGGEQRAKGEWREKVGWGQAIDLVGQDRV